MDEEKLARPHEAFAKIVEKNPGKWQKARQNLHSAFLCMQVANRVVANSRDAAEMGFGNWGEFESDIASEIQQDSEKQSDEWVAFKASWEGEFGEPYPTTTGDYKRWAIRVGMAPKEALRGEISEADIFVLIEGYLQALEDRAEAQQDPPRGGDSPPVPSEVSTQANCNSIGWWPSTVATKLQVTTKTVNSYAKAAKVATPGRGKKNFRYGKDDVVAICRQITSNATDQELVQLAKSFLEEIETK